VVITKYELWYNNIIKKAKKRTVEKNVVYENHHILPKCLGGSDEKDNLVSLTLREHFICHLLLPRFKKGEEKYKMIWALHRMAFTEKYKITSRLYEIIRKNFISSLKENHPSKKETWRKNVSKAVLLEWENNYERRYKTSERMKQSWLEGKLKPKFGAENGMYGIEPWNKGKKFPGTGKSGKDNPSSKKYIVLCPTGEEIMIECLKTFCDDNNLDYGCMKKVSQGKNKQHRGFTILRKEGLQ
jgi:hypothetical protein